MRRRRGAANTAKPKPAAKPRLSAAELNRLHQQGHREAERSTDRLAADLERILLALAQEVAAAFAHAAEPRTIDDSHRVPAGVTAAAPSSTATMIAVYPTGDEQAALALPGGEPAPILHCTLAFLGDTDDETLRRVVQLMGEVAAEHVPRTGTVGGVAVFDKAPDSDALYPALALPDVPGLSELRHAVVKKLDDAGVEFSQNHGWTPHVTLAYTAEPELPPMRLCGMPLTFGFLTVARGDIPIHLGLLGGSLVAAGRVETDDPVLLAIADVAEQHAPDGGYGETFWLPGESKVMWVSADWSTADECDAARDAFLAIDGVDAFEECDECGDPGGDWQRVWWSSASGAAGLVAAGEGETPAPPEWVMPSAGEVLNLEQLAERLREKVEPARTKVVETMSGSVLDKLGIEFDVLNPLIGRALASTSTHITAITDTIRADVMRAVGEGYRLGLSIPNTATLIQEAITDASASRAVTIARTEMVGAVNAGSLASTQIASEVTGLTYMKAWMTAPGAPFPRHEEYEDLDGQTVGLDEMFDVGGAALEFPGDPSGPPEDVINCRCTMEYVEQESEGGVLEDALGDVVVATALPSVRHRTRRTHMASGGPSRTRRRQRRAQRGEQGLSKPLASTLNRAGARHARFTAREALVAAGQAPKADLASSYDLTHGGTLAERAFIEEALASGYGEATSDWWPCDLAALDLAGDDLPAPVVREGDTRAFYRLADSTLALVQLHHDSLSVRVAGTDRGQVLAVNAMFRQLYPASYLVEAGDDRVPITFWSLGTFGPVPRLRKIDAASWEDVETNYPPAVRGSLADLMAWKEPATDGQLIIWQGEPGTGKTWALRALASEWASWAEFHYITDPDAFFVESASYMVDVLLSDSYGAIERATGDLYLEEQQDAKWRVLILEDTGELLAAGAREKYGQGLSRLLNVVDGMIGQGLRVMVLVTTNDELGDLHPAAQRPGRCAQALTFTAFSSQEGSEWLGRDVGDLHTIAELYALLDGVHEPAAAGLAAFAPMDGQCASCDHMADSHEGMDNTGACMSDGCSCMEFDPGTADDEEAAADASTATVDQVAELAALADMEGECSCGHMAADHAGEANDGACMAAGCDCTGFQSAADEPADAPPGDVTAAAATAAVEDTIPPEQQPAETVPALAPTLAEPVSPPVSLEGLSDGQPWSSLFAPEGRPTDDRRVLAPGGTGWRELPLSLMAMLETQEGHTGARLAGRIDSIWRDDDALQINASGVFDAGDFGSEIARLVRDRTLTGLSVDLAIRKWRLLYRSQVLDSNGVWIGLPPEGEDPDVIDLMLDDGDEELLFVVTDAVIGAATVCPFPAFAEASISLLAAGPIPTLRIVCDGGFALTGDTPVDPSLTASAAGLVPERPPVEWFSDPQLDDLTALVVTDQGRIYGHAAPWGACHIGFPGMCVPAPHSATGYRYFHLGEVECDDGSTVAVGKITLGTGHAGADLAWEPAVEHYDDTGTVVAYVRAGEDEHGIWISGTVEPDLPAGRVRELRAAVPSGDWRRIEGNLEMIGVLAVNVPGFPVPRTDALVVASAGGATVLSLTAAGHGLVDDEARKILAGLADDHAGEKLRALAAQAAGDFDALLD